MRASEEEEGVSEEGEEINGEDARVILEAGCEGSATNSGEEEATKIGECTGERTSVEESEEREGTEEMKIIEDMYGCYLTAKEEEAAVSGRKQKGKKDRKLRKNGKEKTGEAAVLEETAAERVF